MYIKQSIYGLEKPNVDVIKVGELAVSFFSNELYTKAIDGKVLYVGSVRKNLSEFNLFSNEGINQIRNNHFLTFNSLYKLTSKLNNISLKALSDVQITNTELLDSYLRFSSINSNIKLSNSKGLSFNLVNLSDVDISDIESKNNYVITYRHIGSGYKSDDEFDQRNRYGYWTLLPEASKLTQFEDIAIKTALKNYSIVRKTRQGSNEPGIAIIDDLQIAGDAKPKLSNHLNAGGNSIFKIQNVFKHINLSNASNTATIELVLGNKSINESIFRFNCTNLNQLDIVLKYLGDTASSYIKPNILVLNKFKGVLKIRSDINLDIEYENGIVPVIFNPITVLSIITQCINGNIKYKIIQRANSGRVGEV